MPNTASMKSMKKSKFSVTPFQPESNTSIGTASRESAKNDSNLIKRPTLSRDNSIISGLDKIQEDVFGGEAESRSELQPLQTDQPEALPRISMSSLQPTRYIDRYSKSVTRTPVTTRATYRPSAMETLDDYYGCDKENGRRESGSSTSTFSVRNSVRQPYTYEEHASDSPSTPPPV